MMNDYRISGPGSQGLWTIHEPNGEAVRFRGAFLQLNSKETASDLAAALSAGRRLRDDEAKRAVFAGIQRET